MERNSSVVVKNTVYLYIRMFITMFVGLYSVRIVLESLGAEDYGIYNLVGGVVAMFAFLQASMTVSTQRYLSYYIGKNKLTQLQKVYSSSVILNFIIGFAIVLILEIVYLFIFDNFLNVNPERVSAAKFVYQMTVASVFFTVNAISYDSAINAHEDLYFDAIIGIIEVLLKLSAAITLFYITDLKLEIYSSLILVAIIIARVAKSVFCHFKYPQYKIKLSLLDKDIIKEMSSFAGWNTFGAACGVVRSQGIAVVLNMFFGATINAAYGIAIQVNGQISGFAQNMLKALRPKIIRAEGKGNRGEMIKLAMIGSRISYFLLFFISLPLIFEMEYVLSLWLKNVPEKTVLFCRLILILTLVNMLTIGLQTAQQATGKIKAYQATIGSTILVTPLISYLAVLLFKHVSYALWAAIAIELLACTLRLIFVKLTTGLSLISYIKKVLIPVVIVTVFSATFVYFVHSLIEEVSFYRLIVCILSSSLSLIVLIFWVGLGASERNMVKSYFLKNRINVS